MGAATVRAAVLKNYAEVAQTHGLNSTKMLRGVGLAPSMLVDPERMILFESVLKLLEDSAQQSGCQTFGLSMAETRQLSDFGVVSLLISHQRTLRDALTTTIEYRHLLNQTLAMDIKIFGKTAIIREEVMVEAGLPKRQATELAIGILYRMCDGLMGGSWSPRSINFKHPAIAEPQQYRRVFHCKVLFDAEFDGIVCNADDLDQPNPKADPAMAAYARRFMDTMSNTHDDSVVFDVRKAIYLLMPVGRASIEQTADGLGTSVRTLQRSLDAADASFTELLNDVRRELVPHYLANKKHSLQRIGTMLGYAVPSSFTRWFTSEFGVSPRVWRRQNILVAGNLARDQLGRN
ncbi:MAG: AraC family transcriptional regulator [Rhodocyclaceae bacterium]|nr:AraC family transcriptional regulator [Rhodocyclaceae bacterium]